MNRSNGAPLSHDQYPELTKAYREQLDELRAQFGNARVTRAGKIECEWNHRRYVEVSDAGFWLPPAPPEHYSVTLYELVPRELAATDNVAGIPAVIAEAQQLLAQHGKPSTSADYQDREARSDAALQALHGITHEQIHHLLGVLAWRVPDMIIDAMAATREAVPPHPKGE